MSQLVAKNQISKVLKIKSPFLFLFLLTTQETVESEKKKIIKVKSRK